MSENKAIYQKNERSYLKDILPLEQPLSLNLEITNACNAKCRYCVHSLSKESQEKIGLMPVVFMTNETFENILKSLREFKHPIKSIRFAGFGEPTLHKNLVSMVKKIKTEKLAQKIIVFTNAFNLNTNLSLKLIEAGVDNFQIDVQGLSEEDYIKNCNMKIDFQVMKSNIKYLYEHKGNAVVYIRTLRFEVDGRENDFYEMFNDMADYLAIDSTCSISDEIDYSDMISEDDIKTDEENVFSVFCPQPFFQLTINVEGGGCSMLRSYRKK